MSVCVCVCVGGDARTNSSMKMAARASSSISYETTPRNQNSGDMSRMGGICVWPSAPCCCAHQCPAPRLDCLPACPPACMCMHAPLPPTHTSTA